MGKRGGDIREIKLIEFQQRIGRKITPDDLVDTKLLSENPKSVRQRKRRQKLKSKQDYENALIMMRENAKQTK